MTFLYSERTGPGLLAEPLNAVTNLAFFVAAWAAWRLARRRSGTGKGTAEPPNPPSSVAAVDLPSVALAKEGDRGPRPAVAATGDCDAAPPCSVATLDPGVAVLVFLLAIIGIGSTLFHTFATEWARMLDVFPILLFQLFFTWLYARTVMRASVAGAAGVLAAFVATCACAGVLPAGALNGSLMYAPAWFFLALLGACHAATRRPERWTLLAAAGVFTLSLSFRTIDLAAAQVFPHGTHFLWHLLNGLTLYLAIRSVIVAGGESRHAS
jgi:hypothetical protein